MRERQSHQAQVSMQRKAHRNETPRHTRPVGEGLSEEQRSDARKMGLIRTASGQWGS